MVSQINSGAKAAVLTLHGNLTALLLLSFSLSIALPEGDRSAQ